MREVVDSHHKRFLSTDMEGDDGTAMKWWGDRLRSGGWDTIRTADFHQGVRIVEELFMLAQDVLKEDDANR